MLSRAPPPRALLAVTLVLVAGLIASGVHPRDRATWWLEVAPVLIVLPVLWATRSRFPLTRLLYVLIAIHGIILCHGGYATYAKAPFGFWMQDVLGTARNPYDRLGHVAQGFVPAIALREILLRTTPLVRGRWLACLVVTLCLGFSAFYELIEWCAAMISATGAQAFLGTQGDPWDTQWDMFLALCGAIAAQALLGRLHDRQLAALPTRHPDGEVRGNEATTP